jgi:IclR family transcriptional regulator, KDG regulon repressor
MPDMDTTLVKGLAILEALAVHGTPRGVTELAQELDLAKSRVHRLLQTLIRSGYVRQDEATSRYECTLKVWELGSFVMERIDVRPAARSCLEALAERSGETALLSVLDGFEVLYVDKIDSPHPVRVSSLIGSRAPSYCVASGKAMLAYAPEAVLEKVFASMKQHTSRTLVSPDALRRELQAVRECGYALNWSEWREGVAGVAAPILDARRGAVAAIAIAGPVERINLDVLKELAPLVVRAGRSTGKAMGLSGAGL